MRMQFGYFDPLMRPDLAAAYGRWQPPHWINEDSTTVWP